MISPEVMFFLSLALLALGQSGIIWMIRDLRVEVVKLALTPDKTGPEKPPVDWDEFDELRQLVFSQNHLIRAAHDEIAELRKGGGCKTATKNVRQKSHARVRNVQKR